ncbi:Nitrate reductase cytochrome c550-type subunit [uncultured Candidatus Thioglobus sp.]|nr:Nitrate reductase cytochrome c550-type subunit [uncultured Candidatus Thioglobus sp.]
MKNKILAATIVSTFALALHADFFSSGDNWNNPMSAVMDSVKDIAIETQAVVKDVTKSAVDTATDAVNSAADTVDLASLRGIHSLDDLSIPPNKNKWIKKNVEFERNFDDQPPLIPHKTEGTKISFTENGCLDCHSNENYKEEEAKKMSSTHFFTRDDVRLKQLSPRRYFCLQCHVPQVDRDALIGNDYTNY